MVEKIKITETDSGEPNLCVHGKCITENQHKRTKKPKKCRIKIKKKSRWNKKLGQKEMSKKNSKEIELINCD
jgi:hypothetical protein